MHDTTQLTADQVATNDVAILLRASWGEAVGLLRRFQALAPSFAAPLRLTRVPGDLVAVLVEPAHAAPIRAYLARAAAFRGTCGWRRPGERLAPVVVNGAERRSQTLAWHNPEQPRLPVRVGRPAPGARATRGPR